MEKKVSNKKEKELNTSINEFSEKVVKINRVNKVAKGGRRLAFRAFVVCGDNNGKVGLGLGKSKEVPSAIKKAIEKAKQSFESYHLFENTIPHEVFGKSGASRVIIKPAKEGTGVIAGGSVRVVLELLGIKNAVGKSLGSRNPINMALATLNALKQCKSLQEEESERNVSIPFSFKGAK
ncbi:30S ribosomal protein S5 [Candidatus Marinamargulisbacteria bacterium SCGC AG-343-D04]|nr:30S ribosomal protein S5 [Candidatus Marinamargulisbacteria bacterium SCGC AG-343-D04]